MHNSGDDKEAGTFPLTEAQSGLWFAQRLDPSNPIFNTGQYLELNGKLDIAAFEAAVNRMGVEAEALSLRFVDRPDGAVQWADPELTPKLSIVDLSQEPDGEAKALAAIKASMANPMTPETGPLARQALYRLSDTRHLWAQEVHHFVNDGYGMVLLTSRVAELYANELAGKPGAGRKFASLEGVFAEDIAYRTSETRAQDAAWWHAAMEDAEEVAGMAPGKAVSAGGFHRFEKRLMDGVAFALLARAKQAGCNWPDALTAIVSAYIRRFTGTDEVTVGLPHMGRMGSASARVPAMVMNVLPLRVAPDEAQPLNDFLAEVAAKAAEARKHGRYRSEQLRRDLGLLGGARRLYGPLINVQPYDKPPRFQGLEVALHVTGTGPVEDINFTFRGDGMHGLTIEVDANPMLYSAAEVAAHGERLSTFLINVLAAERLADVPTATPAEAEHELEFYNATAHPVPDTTLTALLEQAMADAPQSEALRFDGVSLSYADLDSKTKALAQALQARGVGPETLVAVALPRSFELVIALVAVLRTGGAYLPLDLEHPAARIQTILSVAKPAVVLAMDDALGVYGDLLLPVADWPIVPSANNDSSASDLSGDSAAYVIFTSGSTGDPKGVLVEHKAIVNRLLWMGEFYGIGPQDRTLQKTPATFDVSVWEFFLPLITRGCLVIAPPGAHRDPAAIAGLIRKDVVTTLHFVPSMLAAFLAAPESEGLSPKRVFCSGEELPADLRDRFHQKLHAELHNLYGPTEAAVDVSYWPASAHDTARPVPIGHAVWNTRLVILDDNMHPVPQGLAGNLYLGGVQLARGYLGRPDLTAERFIADPFRPGERLYMTGDVARRGPDGAVVYLGRSDHQVKIRGLRIELGEIEAAIADSGLTQSASVIAKDGRLVAYVVPGDAAGPWSVEPLRQAIAARLPDYMVPGAIMALEALPVTANGKLDRKALPEPRFETSGSSAPATPTETTLAAIFAEVLERDDALGAEDDFFTLGGDSLSAVLLMIRIREEWGRDPGLAALFDAPDVAGLARKIDDLLTDNFLADDGLGPVITLARGDESLPPLFLVHPAGGMCWGYRTLAAALTPRRMVYGLQSATLDAAAAEPESIAAIAADYAERIIALAPEGPLHVAGWSVGGIIAQAIAVALADRGRTTGVVALLDSYPAECWRAEPEPTHEQALRALLAIAGYDPEAYPHITTKDGLLTFLQDGDSPLGNLPPAALDGVVRSVMGTNRLIRGHHHTAMQGRLIHIRAGLDHVEKPHLTASLWQDHASDLQCETVPFLHPQMTGAAASALIGPILSNAMHDAEKANGR